MGEIKSTLDLAMERTRHLSLSSEEKAHQQKVDFEKRLQGLLQQYEDQALTADELRQRIAKLEKQLDVSDRRTVTAAVFKRIDPAGDNRRWLELVADYIPAAHAPLRDALDDYRKQANGLRQAASQRMLEQLARHHGIEGPAVVPNPQADPQFPARLQALRRDTQYDIETIGGQAGRE